MTRFNQLSRFCRFPVLASIGYAYRIIGCQSQQDCHSRRESATSYKVQLVLQVDYLWFKELIFNYLSSYR